MGLRWYSDRVIRAVGCRWGNVGRRIRRPCARAGLAGESACHTILVLRHWGPEVRLRQFGFFADGAEPEAACFFFLAHRHGDVADVGERFCELRVFVQSLLIVAGAEFDGRDVVGFQLLEDIFDG
jgi:hypothetical protein